ncbi:MAG: hypothetical protein AUJ75_00305 [Candidatus Omnitrophica bacterium CG1_02_49_10]|nr:MAG: hypothetical protein AUJ75_00305 [Candidatus Omnitrophica bacterium CG1_02_49_10]
MKIFLDKIPPDGKHLEAEYSPDKLDLDTEYVKLLVPVRFSGRVEKAGSSVFLKGEVSVEAQLSCFRCLELFGTKIAQDVELHYKDEGMAFIDITDDIRQQVILGYPIKILCSDDCRGICPSCGKNKNKDECSCGE